MAIALHVRKGESDECSQHVPPDAFGNCGRLALFGLSHSAVPEFRVPGPGWQVMKADWGSGNRWMDVTQQVRILLSGNGMVRVNNANMGGDPAVGADKVLRIHARNFQGQTRQFSFKEGSSIDAGQFYNYGGGIGGGNGPGWQVMWADWGSGNRRMDVTNRVRTLLSGNGMVRVNNANMGGDPAVGADKDFAYFRARHARPSSPILVQRGLEHRCQPVL